MGDQVTPGTIDSASLYLATLDEGRHGATRHGARDRWDWGATAETIARAQNREVRADKLVQQMTPAEREEVWTSDTQETALLRRAVRRMK